MKTAQINLQEFARLEIYDGETLLFFAEGKPDSALVEDKADGTKTVSIVFKWGPPIKVGV